MKSAQIRQAFLDYFVRKGHIKQASHALVPENDESLLFVNSGMAPFKPYFFNVKAACADKIVTSQGCLRAGGKHNDLENVGYTTRHHTFFEMLGNFSFGGYFKQQAIIYAWEFLTQNLQLDPARLWVTVHHNDTESADIWLNKINLQPQRLARLGDEDNFWSMGNTGPCGPCTEIFYDHGKNFTGNPPGQQTDNNSQDLAEERYIEIWNLVFTQYNRKQDGTLEPLPHPCVDTGMGLERIAAIKQGVHDNYATDLFKPIIEYLATLAFKSSNKLNLQDATQIKDLCHPSLKVISDHLRSTCLLISQGVVPSNEGRGYVLRRIIRRAIRHGQKLGIEQPLFTAKLISLLVASLGAVFPSLIEKQQLVEQTLDKEEQKFLQTLDTGLTIIHDAITNLTGTVIDGTTAFLLYDTYGFPLDLTVDIAREHQLSVDLDGFKHQMSKQKDRSRSKQKFTNQDDLQLDCPATTFTGYDNFNHKATVLKIVVDNQIVDHLNHGQDATLVIDKSPFYAQGGGQIGDKGTITSADGGIFHVHTTVKNQGCYLHQGKLSQGQLTKARG